MRADELVKAIEAVGGRLVLNGENIQIAIPEDTDAGDLIDQLREQKPEVVQLLRQRSGIPWPGYHNNQPFVCKRCGLHFDTSSGHAKHIVYVHDFKFGDKW